MQVVGRRVQFWDWSDAGEEVLVSGVVEEEFTEPVEEDAMQRLNYRVRADDGSFHTPYASDCELVQGEQ